MKLEMLENITMQS